MKQWLCAEAYGGTMEAPHTRYVDHEVVDAETHEEARAIYGRKHNCTYWPAACLGEVVEGRVSLPVELVTKRLSW